MLHTMNSTEGGGEVRRGCRSLTFSSKFIRELPHYLINRPVALSLTFGRQGGYHTITGRLQIPTRAARQTNRVAGVLFPYEVLRLVRPSEDGERAERLTNTLFGAKHGGQHHQ